MYDLIIVGGGPAGVAAGIYAARKKIKAAIIYDTIGGQSFISTGIENWIGTKSVSGFEFAKMLEEHLLSHRDIDIFEGDLVTQVEKKNNQFSITTKSGKVLESKTILIASGSRRRKLGIPGEAEFDGKGVAYCSTCDAPIFKDKVVAVVGGGNAGLEAVIDLIPYASKIYLLEYTGNLKGDQITQEKVKSSPKVEIILYAKALEISGKDFVSALKYENQQTKANQELKVDGVFVEIGSVPNADFIKNLVELNKFGEIVVDHKTQKTSLEGVWAAGDVSDVLYKQNNISAGDAVKALLSIHEYLTRT